MDITVYGPLRSATDGKTVKIEFEGGTVRNLIAAFVEAYPRAESALYDEEGELRGSVRVMVDGEKVALDDRCPVDAEVTIFPAMRGG